MLPLQRWSLQSCYENLGFKVGQTELPFQQGCPCWHPQQYDINKWLFFVCFVNSSVLQYKLWYNEIFIRLLDAWCCCYCFLHQRCRLHSAKICNCQGQSLYCWSFCRCHRGMGKYKSIYLAANYKSALLYNSIFCSLDWSEIWGTSGSYSQKPCTFWKCWQDHQNEACHQGCKQHWKSQRKWTNCYTVPTKETNNLFSVNSCLNGGLCPPANLWLPSMSRFLDKRLASLTLTNLWLIRLLKYEKQATH